VLVCTWFHFLQLGDGRGRGGSSLKQEKTDRGTGISEFKDKGKAY